jgi:hypothetical protein
MGKGIAAFILSALLRLESKLIVVACWDASVIRGRTYELGKFPLSHWRPCMPQQLI